MEPLRVAVCEDDPREQESLLALLNGSSVPTACSVFPSGEALLEVYRPALFDLLLLDIYMGKLTGIQTVEKIREFDEDVPIAFLSSSLDFTRESYRLSVFSYMEKPASQKEIDRILRLALLKRESRPVLTLRRGGVQERIPHAEIIYLEQQARRLCLHLIGGREELFYEKLSAIEPQLGSESFFPCHKSYCVNLSHVRRIDRELKAFVMADGSNVPIRRESMASAKKAYEDYLFAKTRSLM